jgi:hypothetical protein
VEAGRRGEQGTAGVYCCLPGKWHEVKVEIAVLASFFRPVHGSFPEGQIAGSF